MRALIELRKRILNGDMIGGTRLFEVPLAEELQISRTPVREAMSRLAEEGLLERVRPGGFMVRTFTRADVIDAIELRGVLEGTAARLAAERGAAPERLEAARHLLGQLEDCLPPGSQPVDLERYSDLNTEFHKVLARLPGSRMVERELTRTVHLPFAAPSAFLPNFGHDLTLAQTQHRALVDAIANREGARAEAVAREHARTARRNLEFVMSGDPSLIGQVPGLALIVD
ncbi:GntR family transcriptional regulator [Mesobaculum littorinae]|nr:GntR family transcriptional regulator [Mesobaculum littorinae]